MSRIRLLLLAVLAVLAVGAVSAVSSASAETCTGGSHLVFCTWPGNVPIVHELVLGLGGLSLLAGQIGGVEAKFHCPDVHFHGKLELLGMSSGLLYFLGCRVEKPAGCKLSAGQEVEVVAHFLAQLESATLVQFTGAGAGEEFTELHVENKPGETCVAAGNFPVTGKQMAEMPSGGEGKENQELVVKKAESSLTMNGNPASFSSKGELHLGGANLGSAWLVMSGE